MQAQTASVYGLKDPRNDEIFYVGMSIDPYARYGQHLAFRVANDAKETRILDMRREGLMPNLIIIEPNIPDKNAREREGYWIRYYLGLGAPLTNKSKIIEPKQKSIQMDEFSRYIYQGKDRRRILRFLCIKPAKGNLTWKEAAMVLAWRAKEECGMALEYNQCFLQYRVKTGDLQVDASKRNCRYPVKAIFELSIEPRRGLKRKQSSTGVAVESSENAA